MAILGGTVRLRYCMGRFGFAVVLLDEPEICSLHCVAKSAGLAYSVERAECCVPTVGGASGQDGRAMWIVWLGGLFGWFTFF